MLLDVPVHDLSTGGQSLLQDSRNKSGASAASAAHLSCNLRLRQGGRHLLLGKNGCGKTTLLRAIRDGLPGVRKHVPTFLVDQDLQMLDLQQTALENVLAADRRRSDLQCRAKELERNLETCQEDQAAIEGASAELNAIYEELSQCEDDVVWEQRAKMILSGLGFSSELLKLSVSELSGGWRMRAALAAALFTEPQLLMLDEPTNHLDIQSTAWLQNYLVEHYTGNKTLLCVSHDRSFINAVLTDIIVFQGKSLTNYAGSLEEFEAAAEQMSKHLEREAAVLEKKKASAEEAIKKHVVRESRSMKNKASNIEHRKYGDAQALFYGSSQSSKVTALNRKLERVGMEKTLDGKKFKASEHGSRLGSLDDNEGDGGGRALAAAPLIQKQDPALRFAFEEVSYLGISDDMPVLQLQDVAFQFSEHNTPLLSNVTLSLSAKSRIVIVGANGAGKSTLLNLIVGSLEPTAGQVWRHRNLKIASLDQHEASVLQHLKGSPLSYLQEAFPSRPELELRAILGNFGMKGSTATQPMDSLSGGQRMRVAFAKICAERPQMLVLDEPTNHLDIYSIDSLTDALQKFQGAVILVTHNRSMLEDIAKEVVVVQRGACATYPVTRDTSGGLLDRLLLNDPGGPQANVGHHQQVASSGANRSKTSLSMVAAPDGNGRTHGGNGPSVSHRSVEDGGTEPELAGPPNTSFGTNEKASEEKHSSIAAGATFVDISDGPLRVAEKEFLKSVKKVREMLKLEDLKAKGSLNRTQEEKLRRKDEALKELAFAMEYLDKDSALRGRNADLLPLLPGGGCN